MNTYCHLNISGFRIREAIVCVIFPLSILFLIKKALFLHLLNKNFLPKGIKLHEEVFENFISICNTGRDEYAMKLKGSKKCNLQFAVFGAKASCFSIIRAI